MTKRVLTVFIMFNSCFMRSVIATYTHTTKYSPFKNTSLRGVLFYIKKFSKIFLCKICHYSISETEPTYTFIIHQTVSNYK